MTSEQDPINPPIPIPNVSGADVPAGADGLPPCSALSSQERMAVGASAIGDLALRTWVASVLATTVTPNVVATSICRTRSGTERSNLNFYAELAAEQDPAKSFPPPTQLPRVSSRPARLFAERVAHGTVDNIAFASSFTAINPAMRKEWRALRSNNIVCAQHWRHADGPRPTLCVIHGFMGSSYLLNGWFFSLPWYYRSGYDVLLYTLPFHGPRAEKFSPFSGFGYFARGLSGFAEAMAQAVHDFHSIVDYLRRTGVDRIALTGISLGGYTSALLAAVDARLAAVIPNCPVVAPTTMMLDEWFPANVPLRLGLWLSKISRDELVAGLSYHCPLNYPPLLPKDRRMIITGLGDRLAPPRQAVMLWEHWDRCALHWFPGSHVLHVSQLDYLRRMSAFLHQVMFD
ncbi:alpha/beta hydrolase family protein [Mycobacterium haemophilum]|uniref:Peptidase n=1 Tax=Mycobacterium haemophilum TaxID=29311 RepID=A0A0I9YKA3_9MYCO|nr:alpha/beta fold hydrolase [Mycobacterium haemophilum]KLO27971.1 peptidase [Mycobacterium haemophilum]KLO35368.1 peptidase [Mycobacterium haemophilum]KLO40557.1 peptidase [Mycobacterium haemophilum]KLO47975.1 peptidase [Mycobacterium haemophilum]